MVIYDAVILACKDDFCKSCSGARLDFGFQIFNCCTRIALIISSAEECANKASKLYEFVTPLYQFVSEPPGCSLA